MKKIIYFWTKRKRAVQIDLKGYSLQDVFANVSNRDIIAPMDIYLNSSYSENNVIITMPDSKAMDRTNHHLIYYPNEHKVSIETTYPNNGRFIMYIYSFIFIVPVLFFKGTLEEVLLMLKFGGIMFLLITLILIFSINDKSKEMERELINRVGFTLRKGH